MGVINVTVKLTSFGDIAKSYETLFLVDTGATDSLAPDEELKKIGIKPEGEMSYELADGTVKKYPYGIAKIEFMGETTAGRVIFGEADVEPILGVTALESVGILVDPANRTFLMTLLPWAERIHTL